jgi:hypothetical protein
VTEEGVDGRGGGVLGLLARLNSGGLILVGQSPADNSLVAWVGLDSVEEEELSFPPEGRVSRSLGVMWYFVDWH